MCYDELVELMKCFLAQNFQYVQHVAMRTLILKYSQNKEISPIWVLPGNENVKIRSRTAINLKRWSGSRLYIMPVYNHYGSHVNIHPDHWKIKNGRCLTFETVRGGKKNRWGRSVQLNRSLEMVIAAERDVFDAVMVKHERT